MDADASDSDKPVNEKATRAHAQWKGKSGDVMLMRGRGLKGNALVCNEGEFNESDIDS